MTTPFKKGQLATLIQDWDNKGTVSFQHVIVHSCGKIQMVLINEASGENLGNHFKPRLGSVESPVNNEWYWSNVFPRMTDDEAHAACLKLADHILANERKRMEHAISCSTNPNYIAAVRKSLNELHEPRSLDRSKRIV